MSSDRPPAYVSRSTLARELDMSESTVNEMVRRGVLPRPVRLSSGCVRWRWASVELALGSLAPRPAPAQEEDPFIVGARRAAEMAKEQKEARLKGRKPE